MSDFAKWIAKAVRETFPGGKHGKCFFHLKSNVKKKYPKHFSYLEAYLESMGNCNTNAQLEALWEIIKKDMPNNKELESIQPEFISYFESTYFKKEERTFYIGFLPPGYGNTNNMLEGHHRFLKRDIFEYQVRKLCNIFLFFILFQLRFLT